MDSHLYGNGRVTTTLLPNGHQLPMRVAYTAAEDTGVVVRCLAVLCGLLLMQLHDGGFLGASRGVIHLRPNRGRTPLGNSGALE
jgi:hypothetical protein